MGRTIKSKNKGVASLSESASARSVRQKRVGTSSVQDGSTEAVAHSMAYRSTGGGKPTTH
ncbi:hypothetical protein HanPSC8_Chr06g0239511 [Helianthus annuus]|nr:hypothetical protein HanPSC8_Chr06g0239511 [Helianthus annuus]